MDFFWGLLPSQNGFYPYSFTIIYTKMHKESAKMFIFHCKYFSCLRANVIPNYTVPQSSHIM